MWAQSLIAGVGRRTGRRADRGRRAVLRDPVVGSETDVFGAGELPALRRALQLDSEAVLDRETALVWQKQPTDQKLVWNVAFQWCIGAVTGGRKGWRLASVHELQSLIDANVFDAAGDVVSLPLGHPFVGITAGLAEWYWTNTSFAIDPTFAYRVGMASDMGIASSLKGAPGLPHRTWCVRGGGPIDAQ